MEINQLGEMLVLSNKNHIKLKVGKKQVKILIVKCLKEWVILKILLFVQFNLRITLLFLIKAAKLKTKKERFHILLVI